LNYFTNTVRRLYLVDMPGYGFAKAPKEKVDAWTELVRDYLRGRQTLARVMLLIDARHGIKPVDETIMALMNEAAVSFQVVLTKSDKLSERALPKLVASVQSALASHPAAYPAVLTTSSEKGLGIADLRATIMRLSTQYA